MKKASLAVVAALSFGSVLFAQSKVPQQQEPALSEPALSPDGSEIAFVSGGDIWTVPAAGGEARLLVSHPATESRPLYSPDGRSLAFISTRTGNGDIYVLDLSGGLEPRRVTYDDGLDQLDAWSRDGKWLYFSSSSRDIARMNDIWRVPVGGGTPQQVTAERYVNEYFAAPTPDGKGLAFAARGISSAQWWRHGHSHIDESQIILMRDLTKHDYAPLTADGAKEIWPMWSPDGGTLWFDSDRSGSENIWSLVPGSQPRQVTKFTGGRLLWPSIANDGRSIVFERDFGIWKLDTASGQATQVRIIRRGSPSGLTAEHRRTTDHFSDLAVSPDNKKLVFVARGQLFAASVKDAGEAVRLTNTSGLESQPAWSSDSKSVVYVSDREGRDHLYRYDFATEHESQLTSGDGNDDTPRFSPDGKSIAFQRDGHDLMILDPTTKEARSVAKALLDRPPLGSERPFDWSPDSKWLAYLRYDDGVYHNLYVVPAAGGASHAVSFLANANSDYVSWSHDGRFVLMSTGQRTEQGQIARVDLVPLVPKFREDQFRDLFREPTTPEEKPAAKTAAALEGKTAPVPAAPKKPIEIVFDGIRERARVVPVGLDVDAQVISPDGKWIAFAASTGNDQNIYVYSIDELEDESVVPRQVSSTSSRKHDLQWSSDSKDLYYIDGGKIAAATIEPMRSHPVAVSAELDVDFSREKEEAFRQAWTYLRDNFFDAGMHGADWNSVRADWQPRVAAAANPDELRRLLNLMVGELNASHLGANPPGDAAHPSTGRIGVRFDREAYETSGTLRVSEVIPLSPADVAGIKVDDAIVAVDGHPTGAGINFDALLEYHAGKRTTITLAGTTGKGNRDVVVQPIRSGDERQLTYRAWVNANRDYVNRISGGHLGYVHMFDMSAASLSQLFVDLDAENRSKDGVVIDVRNNNGGFVNVYAIDVLARLGYLTMQPRDFPHTSARTLLGQRSLERPTVLVTNRHSLSDAEDFTEGYRALKLGKVVGEPTAGWIIFTAETSLIDGTSLRLPTIRVMDADGKDLEMHPRPVDTFVQRPIGESYQGKDSQLDAAVKELIR